jgi:hypothetical protein
MDILMRQTELLEPERRRPGASGVSVTLADDQAWLLARPSYRPRQDGLTQPAIDQPLDRIFEAVVLNEALSLGDLWEVARELLRANYELTDEELGRLLSVAPGSEAQRLAASIVDAVAGSDPDGKSYTAWVRASLLANGLASSEILARDLANVLAILVATKRTIPLSRFADACRLLDERARLEVLI